MRNIMMDIKNQTFQSVYILYGEEDYLKQQYKNRLREGICGEDTMNVSYFEGKSLNVNEILSMADTLPFFAEHRLILIENSGFFKSANEKMTSYMEEIPETTIFVFVEDEVDKRSKMFKKVKEKGYPCEMTRQTPATLEKWILGLLKKEGKQMDRKTLDYFLAVTGNDMNQISNELEKVLSYTLGQEKITMEHINEVCSVTVVGKIFDMIDAMGAKDRKKTMKLYYDMIEVKEPPMRILYMLARQFEIMIRAGEQKEQGSDVKSIASKLGLAPFIVNKALRQYEKFPQKVLKKALNDCLMVEEDVKNGRLEDKAAVELILIRYTQKSSGK